MSGAKWVNDRLIMFITLLDTAEYKLETNIINVWCKCSNVCKCTIACLFVTFQQLNNWTNLDLIYQGSNVYHQNVFEVLFIPKKCRKMGHWQENYLVKLLSNSKEII